jgi:hypothetical protein
LKILFQNTQTLQLFTLSIKTEVFTKVIKNTASTRLGLRVLETYN